MENVCDYGCGQRATFFFEKAKKFCCSDHYRKCPFQAKTIGKKRIGKVHSEETKAKIGKASKLRIEQNGHPNAGNPMSAERKQLLSQRMSGKVSWAKGLTAETDSRVWKLREYKRAHPEKYRNCGEANGMYGKTHTAEVKQRLRTRNLNMLKWVGADNYWHGKDRSGPNSPRYLTESLRREWLTYKSQTRYWTEKTYLEFTFEINPTNVPRGIRQYHLDHIIPVWYGFMNKIDPKLLARKENLRMIWYLDNLARSKTILDEQARTLLVQLQEQI